MARLPAIQSRAAELHATVLKWYRHNKRQFPWRSKDVTPYQILVSEVMLQQTQTARVQEKLPAFLAQFPDPAVLAAADNATIIRAWKGMGYNSRAIRLRDCARAIVDMHAGRIPDTQPALLALPGIGRYTASAVLAFAYGRDVAVVDVNIQRVYSRIFWRLKTTTDSTAPDLLHRLAERVFPRGASSDWHQALMDIGAQFCLARKPRCTACPLAGHCRSAGKLQSRPAPKKVEPSFQGIPNRIWRGRIVEHLRSLAADQTLSSVDLMDRLLGGDSLFPEQTEETHTWLQGILRGLARDSLVSIQADKHTKGNMLVQLAREQEAAGYE